VVHNSASDMVGIITMEDVLQDILGRPATKEQPKKEEQTAKEPEDTGGEQVAVVE